MVAGEVKALAMQTSRSTEEITRHLGEVRTATAASVEAVGRIGETISEINSIATSIATAVEEQGAATAEIARNVSETAHSAGEMTSRLVEVSAEAEENDHQAGQVHEGAAELAEAVGDLKRTVVRVVRTSTGDVDRRGSDRHPVNIPGQVTVPGQGPLSGRITEVAGGGADSRGCRGCRSGPPARYGWTVSRHRCHSWFAISITARSAWRSIRTRRPIGDRQSVAASDAARGGLTYRASEPMVSRDPIRQMVQYISPALGMAFMDRRRR